MKEIIANTLRQALECYNDVDELMFLVEQTDYEGNDCFWYLDEYDLYRILDCRMMDRVIQKKWQGKYDINSDITDYSTSHCLIYDKYNIFADDNVFQELSYKILKLNCSD